MVKKLLLIFFAILIGEQLNAQQILPEQARQVSVENGVVNYETAGVEGFVSPQAEQPAAIVKPVTEWDLQQCNDMLISLDMKIQHAAEEGDQQAVDYYQSAKNAVLARKAVLTNQTQGQ